MRVEKITDNRGVRLDPFNLPPDIPLINPVSWEIFNTHEDGFVINDNLFNGNETLLRIKDNEIIEAYRLVKLTKSVDIL